jgi:hypothetical protein
MGQSCVKSRFLTKIMECGRLMSAAFVSALCAALAGPARLTRHRRLPETVWAAGKAAIREDFAGV